MATLLAKAKPGHDTATAEHPLSPLSEDEIHQAVALVRATNRLGRRTRFISIGLREPPKPTVLQFRPGMAIEREAIVCVLDHDSGMTSEVVVGLTAGKVLAWTNLPGVQPSITPEEFVECEAAVKRSPAFREALRKRGITDAELVMVDPWSVGWYGEAKEKGRRLTRGFCWLRRSARDNGYARPLEGLHPLVDLNAMEVIEVEDHGIVPLPPDDGNYAAEFQGSFRTDLKPLEIVQPEGPSFTVNGNEVAWQKWRFRIGFTAREGLVLHQVGYEDQGRLRPLLYRASLAEMVVPYGDPGKRHYTKNAFDVGEYGVGYMANSLKLGCDCLGEVRYFDAVVATSTGEAVRIENAVCLHEEDYGVLWRHRDWRTGDTEIRRSRRLVVSFFATVGNYDYGFFWYLYQDGHIQFEVKLTGILNTAAVQPEEKPRYGTLVARQVYAQIHQHIFNVRLDMEVDGPNNSVFEVNTRAVPPGPDNPQGNAFVAEATLLATELAARRRVDPASGRHWLIANGGSVNALGEPVAYRLKPGENGVLFPDPGSSVAQRAGFASHHLWVTPYDPGETFPAGDYPNQHAGGDGLPAWTQKNRPVADTDIVIWYTFAHLHVPRPEDWPVMPAGYVGFMLEPVGFFERNPALDVPPPHPKACH
jgi:primary-amine oxidase